MQYVDGPPEQVLWAIDVSVGGTSRVERRRRYHHTKRLVAVRVSELRRTDKTCDDPPTGTLETLVTPTVRAFSTQHEVCERIFEQGKTDVLVHARDTLLSCFELRTSVRCLRLGDTIRRRAELHGTARLEVFGGFLDGCEQVPERDTSLESRDDRVRAHKNTTLLGNLVCVE